MIGKSPLAGWVVQLSVPAPITPPRADGMRWVGAVVHGAPLLQYFNVAIADKAEAVEVTRKRCGAGKDAMMTSVRALSALEVASIPLMPGEVKAA
jgi:hypothetical protein